MSIRLIVNADDYGRTPGVSAGVREAHLHGIVTSTTAMMNMPDVEEALHLAARLCPHLGLGVHLVLTAGAPLLPPGRVPSLTNGADRFPTLDTLVSSLAAIDPDELRMEWREQVERFIDLTRSAPDHLDSHHHVSYLTPLLFRTMLELAREYGCAVRPPQAEGVSEEAGDLPLGLPDRPAILRLLEEAQPRRPDRFYASFYGPSATRHTLLDILARLPDGTAEVMCHPGYADAELLAGSSYNRQREAELLALTDPEVAAAVRTRQIELIPYSRL